MYLCLCRAVSESDVQEALEAGHASLEGVQRCCGAGGDCGSCRERLKEFIRSRAPGKSDEGAPEGSGAA